jgi:hypothetical protein
MDPDGMEAVLRFTAHQETVYSLTGKIFEMYCIEVVAFGPDLCEQPYLIKDAKRVGCKHQRAGFWYVTGP